jgi:hypothetical protein
MMALAGVGILVAGVALLQAFRPAPGQTVQRAEWIDVSVAITVTTALACGAMLAAAGIAGFLFPQP